jgi:hypothetical protein
MEPQIVPARNTPASAKAAGGAMIRRRPRRRRSKGDGMRRLAGWLGGTALLLAAGTAGATQSGIVAMRNWKVMDDCARKAQLAFPDFTAEANAKRDARLKECLTQHNLPPRTPLPR